MQQLIQFGLTFHAFFFSLNIFYSNKIFSNLKWKEEKQKKKTKNDKKPLQIAYVPESLAILSVIQSFMQWNNQQIYKNRKDYEFKILDSFFFLVLTSFDSFYLARREAKNEIYVFYMFDWDAMPFSGHIGCFFSTLISFYTNES